MMLGKLKTGKVIYTAFLWLIFGTVMAQGNHEFSLDGSWQFKIDPNNMGESEEWFKASTPEAFWDKMEVPGNWDLHNEYAHYIGKGWYQKTFVLPADWKRKNFILHFEAVYHDCTVWLNGRKLGENNSGFLPFEFEITDYLASDRENTLTVCADNTFKRGAIWNWGGIRRPVKITAYEGVKVSGQHITPMVDLEKKTADVAIRVFLENFTSESAGAEGEVLLAAGNGYKQVLPFSTTIPAHGKKEIEVNAQIGKGDFYLWHFDDPFLYQSSIKLNNGQSPDISDAFGLRKIEVDADSYEFRLNGEPVRLMGLNLVPDGRTTGNTMPLWRIKQDVDLMKSLNSNFTRLSHLPLPKEMLDYLDERGILVFSEIPLWGYDPLADPDNKTAFEWMERLARSQYNHPSIVGWSTGNEIGYYPTAKDYVAKSLEFARGLDSTRLASTATHTAHFDDDFIQFTDLGMVNKYGENLTSATRLLHEKYPDKVLFYSEYGTNQFGEGLDATFNIRSMAESIRNFPYLVGASLWTFNDYRSNFLGTRELSENRSWGVVDVYRRKKKAYYDLQKEHAPLRAMRVDVTGTTARIRLEPRQKLDLPAYILKGYKIVYQLFGSDDQLLDGGVVNLPETHPGQPAWTEKIQWQADQPHAMELALLNPQMDVLLDTVVYFQKPPTPGHYEVFGGRSTYNSAVRPESGFIRVFYDKVPHAAAYKLRYGTAGNLDKETGPSVDDYLDVTGLEPDGTYQVQLVAVNPIGETAADPVEVTISQRDMIPPGVRYVEPGHESFFVAYHSDELDFLYRIRYREKGVSSDQDRTIQSRNPGMMAVRGLKNGQAYTFEVQRVLHNNYYSLWSKTFEITPDGEIRASVPNLKGIFRKEREAILSFNPVPKAVGYEIGFREVGKGDSEWKTLMLNRSEVSYAKISDLRPNITYEFRMAAINAYGKSDYTPLVKQ